MIRGFWCMVRGLADWSIIWWLRCTITWGNEIIRWFGSTVARYVVTWLWGPIAWFRGIITRFRRKIRWLTWSTVVGWWRIVRWFPWGTINRAWWTIWRPFVYRWAVVIGNGDSSNGSSMSHHFYGLNVLDVSVVDIWTSTMMTTSMRLEGFFCTLEMVET